MIADLRSVWGRGWVGVVSIGSVLSVAALAWLGYRAITEWQRSADLVAQRSADAAADLLFTALTRDMRGVQATVLSSLQFDDGAPGAAFDLNAVASAFARYPYPEVFFGARMDTPSSGITFYSRANRPALWLPISEDATAFPVVAVMEQRLSEHLLERIARDAKDRKALAAFDESLGGATCQVVALLAYSDSTRRRLDHVSGFVVNLDWVHRNYFQELVSQIGQMRGSDSGLQLSIEDTGGSVRAGVATAADGFPSSAKRFPMLFFDPAMIDLDPPEDLAREVWTARASIASDHEVMAARTGARVTLMVAAISALVLAGGLALSAKAALARARLTDMRSDFVAAVTHDLKTPIATIRAIGESFLIRPDVDRSTRRDYGQIVLHEARRLTRLIDNLLAYARISDVTDAYTFQPTLVAGLVTRTLKEFSFQLESADFTVAIDIPADLPPVRADGLSLSLALGNLFDNAIRYSLERHLLTVRARTAGHDVLLEVIDAGIGIPSHEIPQVTQKFYRGAGTTVDGSGLGLAIAQRIVSDHAGAMSIASEVGRGTTVSLTLPTAPWSDDDTDTDS